MFVIWDGFLCCTRVKWWIRKHHICFIYNQNIFAVKHIWSFRTALSVPLSHLTGYSFILTPPFSFWWADHWWRMMMLRWWRYRWDAVKWGSPPTCRPRKQEILASLPATHTALWFYRWVCVITHLLLNVRVGMWGVTICHSDVMSHMRVCVFGRDCEGHLCCYWQSGFSSHMKMILVSSSSSPSSSVVSPAWGPWEHSLAPFCGSPGRFQHVLVWEQRLEFNWNFPASHCRQINKGRSPDSFCLCASVHIDLTLWCMVFSSVDCFCVIICTFKSESL